MKLHTVTPSAADAKFVGYEPTWDDKQVIETNYVKEMIRGLNWHNYVVSEKNIRLYLVEWATKYAPLRVSMIDSIPENKLDRTLAIVGRMQLQGFPLKEHHTTMLMEYLNGLAPKRGRKPVVQVAKKTSLDPQEKVKRQLTGTLADIDQEIDIAFDRFEIDSPKILDLVLTKGFRSPQLRIVAQYIESHVNEWKSAYGEKDPDLYEGYRYVGKRKFKKIIDTFAELVSNITYHADNVSRKVTKKKKPIDKAKTVKSLKFLKNFSGVDGQEASLIIGAKKLWIFDIKTRKLAYYVAENAGFHVRGTLVENVEKCEGKTLRWPETQLQDFMRVRGKASDMWYNSLTTKSSTHHHRITPNMILLRVE